MRAPDPLEATTWRVTGPFPVPDGVTATAQFRDGVVSGTSGCNRYRAPYELGDGGRFGLTAPPMSTLMACAPEAMELERSVHEGLAAATRLTREGATLTIADDEGRTLLVLTLVTADDLAGEWHVIAMHRPEREAIVSVDAPADRPLTVRFERGDDGWRVGGHAGCNSYTGPCTVEDDRVSVGPLASTRKWCAEPGVMDQEQALLAALAEAAGHRLEGDRLTLVRTDGGIAVELRRA